MPGVTELLLLFLCGIVLLIVLGASTFWILLQLGVIAAKATEKPTVDYGNYTLQQGEEVRAEQDQPHEQPPQR
jgi:hypothetical protein